MTIYTTFIPDQYCVYHTTYSGSLMPANYIGSTSVDNVLNKNYRGSVVSKIYKSIWKSEIKLHPELFSTDIVSYHDTRSDATWKELQVQRTLNVVKSDLFVNRSYATVNGFQDTIFSPEELASRGKNISDAHANRSPEEKAATSKNHSNSWDNKTPEEKAASSKKHSETKAKKKAELNLQQAKIARELVVLYLEETLQIYPVS